eukprot:864853-Amphidinium_carterae.1
MATTPNPVLLSFGKLWGMTPIRTRPFCKRDGALSEEVNFPEHAILKWKQYCWARLNVELPPHVRLKQATSGVASTAGNWWARILGGILFIPWHPIEKIWKAEVDRVINDPLKNKLH